jgi:hypothetical protein
MADDQALIPAPPVIPAVGDKPKDVVDILRERYQKLQDKDLSLTAAVNRFAELPNRLEDPEGEKLAALLQLDDAGLKAAGWKSRKELRLAIYGTMPKRLWPAAAQAAHERVGMRLRKAAANKAKTNFYLNMITIPAPKRDPQTKVVIVDVEEKKAR